MLPLYFPLFLAHLLSLSGFTSGKEANILPWASIQVLSSFLLLCLTGLAFAPFPTSTCKECTQSSVVVTLAPKGQSLEHFLS